jgi:translation initiation factor IF-1
MVKNIHGGNKTKKQKRGFQKNNALERTVQGQMFGQVVENRGDHFAVLCSDNVTRMGKLSGAAKRGQRLVAGSFVVLSVRDYETDQKNCDIIGIANPPPDVRNIFKKINPIDSNNNNIGFQNQDDKFKEFEESEVTKTSNVENTLSLEQILNPDLNNQNSNETTGFCDDLTNSNEIYKDPTVQVIDWDDL